MSTLAVTPPDPRCLSATGVLGKFVYRARATGGWEVYARGRPETHPLWADTASTFAEAWKAARNKAEELNAKHPNSAA